METYNIGVGDIFITKDGKKRLIVGGNRSYGLVTYITIDIDTCEIKSRLCDRIETLLLGYEIVGIVKAEDVEINPCKVNEVDYSFVEEEEEEIEEETVNEMFDRIDVEIFDDDNEDNEDDDDEY